MNLRVRKRGESVSLSYRDEKRRSDVLEVGAGNVLDVASDASDVGVVERGIDLVEHEEGRGVVAVRAEKMVSLEYEQVAECEQSSRVDGEEEREGSHGTLSSRKLVHVAEALHGRHRVVLDAVQVGFLFTGKKRSVSLFSTPSISTHLAVLQTEVSDTSHRRRLALGQVLVHLVDAVRDVLVGLVEQLAALLLDGGEGILCRLGRLAGLVELAVDLLEAGFRVAEAVERGEESVRVRSQRGGGSSPLDSLEVG